MTDLGTICISECCWICFTQFTDIFSTEMIRKKNWSEKMFFVFPPLFIIKEMWRFTQESPEFNLNTSLVVNDSWRLCEKRCCLRWPWPSLAGSSFSAWVARRCGRWRCSTYALFCRTKGNVMTAACIRTCIIWDTILTKSVPPASEFTD